MRTWEVLLLTFISSALLTGTAIAQSLNPVPPSTNTSSVPASENQTSRSQYHFQGNWHLGLEGAHASDEISNQRTQTTLSMNSQLSFIFNSWLSIHLHPVIKYRSGFIQADPNAQLDNSVFDLRQAAVLIAPDEAVQLTMGALNQKHIHSSLLFANRAFPAARLQLASSEKNIFSMGIRGQAAVPTSMALSNNAQEKEATPSFNSLSVYMGLHSESVDLFLGTSTFQFKNLPLLVSTKSGLLGNDVVPVNSTDSAFAYEFEGLELHSILKWQLGRRFGYRLELAGAQNSSAPASLNQAYWAHNSAIIDLTQKWALIPSYEFFRIEPNAVVAIYNEDYMNSNRNGFLGGLALRWNKTIQFGLKAGTREALYEKYSQPRENMVALAVETLDVSF